MSQPEPQHATHKRTAPSFNELRRRAERHERERRRRIQHLIEEHRQRRLRDGR
jgi:hypothetical protein